MQSHPLGTVKSTMQALAPEIKRREQELKGKIPGRCIFYHKKKNNIVLYYDQSKYTIHTFRELENICNFISNKEKLKLRGA